MTVEKKILFTTAANYKLLFNTIHKEKQSSQACAYIHLLTYISLGFEESHPDFPAGVMGKF